MVQLPEGGVQAVARVAREAVHQQRLPAAAVPADDETTISRLIIQLSQTQPLYDILLICVTCCVVFGGAVPYYFQYREMKQNQSARGFSLYVCLSLLLANILRIMFWLGKQFETQLLLQSCVMISSMLLLVELAVRIRRSQLLPPSTIRSLWDGHFRTAFWQWTDFSSYVLCVAAFFSVSSFISLLFLHNQLYIEIVGYVALSAEGLLGLPQFLNNYRRKSTYGMSVRMVFMWLLGDASKTVYFGCRHAPLQFLVCGVLQIMMDFCLLAQVAYYSSTAHRHGPMYFLRSLLIKPLSHLSSLQSVST